MGLGMLTYMQELHIHKIKKKKKEFYDQSRRGQRPLKVGTQFTVTCII